MSIYIKIMFNLLYNFCSSMEKSLEKHGTNKLFCSTFNTACYFSSKVNILINRPHYRFRNLSRECFKQIVI